MKKWIAMGVIVLCCGVYAMVKFSSPQDQSVPDPTQGMPSAKQADAGNAGRVVSEESSGPAVPAVQVEAVTKALAEFQGCLKDKKYEQAWELTTEYFKQRVSDGNFEKFKENMAGEGAGLATATVHPASAAVIEGRVGLLVTSPSLKYDLYMCFVQDNGKWKLDIGRPAHSVNTTNK